MLQRIQGIGALAFALAFASHSSIARAEGSNDDAGDSKGGSDEGKKATPSRADDGKKRSDPKASNDRGGSNDRRNERSSLRLNEAFTFPVAGGCQYSSTIRGTVKQARTSNGDEPKFTPSLVVNAWVTCQNNTELRVTDNTLKETAMTRSELEQAIELRGSLLNESMGKRCAYVPDFTWSDNRLASFGVSFLCPSANNSSTADNQAPTENKRASDSRRGSDSRADTRAATSDSRATSDTRAASESHGGTDRASSERRGSSDKGNQGNQEQGDQGSTDDGQ